LFRLGDILFLSQEVVEIQWRKLQDFSALFNPQSVPHQGKSMCATYFSVSPPLTPHNESFYSQKRANLNQGRNY